MCSSNWSSNDPQDHKYSMNLLPNLWTVEQHASALNSGSNQNGRTFPSPVSTPSTMNVSVSPANSNPSTTISSSTTTSVPSSPSASQIPHLLNDYLLQKTSELNNTNYPVFNTSKPFTELVPPIIQQHSQQQQQQQQQQHHHLHHHQQQHQQQQYQIQYQQQYQSQNASQHSEHFENKQSYQQQLPPELLQSFENLNLASLLQNNSRHNELSNGLSTSELNASGSNNPQVILHYNVNVQYEKSANSLNLSVVENNNNNKYLTESSNASGKKSKKKGSKKATKKNKVTIDPLLYKTELCAQYERSNGSCPYGSKCQYAHGLEELQRVTKSSSFKTKDCENWIRFGSCRYGRRCCFKHGDEELPANVIVNDKKSKKKNQNGEENIQKLLPSSVIEQSTITV